MISFRVLTCAGATVIATALLAAPADAQLKRSDARQARFGGMDRNGDGAISRSEWRGSESEFRRQDWNNDGVLSGDEVAAATSAGLADFQTLDQDGNGRVTVQEWRRAFNQLDNNRDGALTEDELGGERNAPVSSQAFVNGRVRGIYDGRQAGYEDARRRVWDLDGQRELEQADAGYNPGFGPRAQYQAGYREGFRQGYAEGFGPRR